MGSKAIQAAPVASHFSVGAGFGECSADFEAEIVEVELLAHRGHFAACLTFGFLGAAGHVDGDLGIDLRVQHNRDCVQAEGLDRALITT